MTPYTTSNTHMEYERGANLTLGQTGADPTIEQRSPQDEGRHLRSLTFRSKVRGMRNRQYHEGMEWRGWRELQKGHEARSRVPWPLHVGCVSR